MKKIICFGEALIDMLNTEGTHYQAFVGGAPANVAVGIAKLGANAAFIGQVGSDKFGCSIIQFLREHNVDVNHLLKHSTAKTALAFVQLDEDGERSFSFYREGTADVLMDKSQLSVECFQEAAVLHLCSNTLTTQIGFEMSTEAIDLAKQQNALVSFDLNLRSELWPNGVIEQDKLTEIIEQADIVKFAAEELEQVAGAEPQQYIQHCLDSGVQLIVVTNGSEPIQYYSQSNIGSISVAKTKAVDTTGAGDSFIAGLLTAIVNGKQLTQVLAEQRLLEQVIGFASECSAVTVSRYGACASFPKMSEVSLSYELL